MRAWTSVAAVLCVLAMAADVGAQAAAAGTPEYLDGLDALENAKWPDAIDALTKAIDADEDNPDYRTARGVANALAEKLKDAERDLSRALKLSPNLNEAKLWLASVVAMSGDFQRDSTIYPAATRVLYESSVREMSRWYGEINFRKNVLHESESDAGPDEVRRWSAQHEKARGRFADLARQFVARAKAASPNLAAAMLDRAKKRYERNDAAGALRDLQLAWNSRPDDPELLRLYAGCQRVLGGFELARDIYTQLLTGNTEWGEIYLERALCDAAIGNAPRARADLLIGAALAGAKTAGEKYFEPVQQALERLPAPRGREDLASDVKRLAESAAGNMKGDELRKQAMAIVWATNSGRLRLDETYQDGLRVARQRVKKEPQNADRWAELAEFLYRQAERIYGEAVEPRAEFKPFRPRNEQAELQQAEASADKALSLDPNQVKAMATKAACQMQHQQWDSAQRMLKQALELKPDDAYVLGLFAQVMDHIAAVDAAQAAGLRSTRVWEDAFYIYYRQPSKADLDAANELDRIAAELWETARQALTRAVETHKGTAAGYYYAGVLARRQKDLPAALAAFDQSVRMAPDDLDAREQYSILLAQTGHYNEAIDQQADATNRVHTTAAPYLKLAWVDVQRTAYKASRTALDKALARDPADTRVAAYFAMVNLEDKPQQALGWLRTAAAIEEARLQLRGVRLNESSVLNPADVGLWMVLNLKAARLMLDQGHADEAYMLFRTNLLLEPRFEKGALYEPVSGAMLPEPGADAFTPAQAQMVVELLAWSRLGLARAMVALNHPAEAMQQFAAVAQYEKNVPPTVDARGPLRDPQGWAVVAMARAALQRGHAEEAYRILIDWGHPMGISKELDAEYRKLEADISAAREQGGGIEFRRPRQGRN